MASISYPNPDYNGGAVTVDEHEQLTHSGLGTGIVGHPATTSQVAYADGTGTRAIHLRAEKRVIVRGLAWYSGASVITLNAAANASGSTRIDRAVLRVDRSAETVTEQIITGTPGSGVPPTLTNNAGPGSGVWDFPLGRATVVSGATTLAAEDFIPEAWYLGGQSIITNGANTVPSAAQHQGGTVRYDYATGQVYVSNGSDWLLLYDRSGKLNLTAATGWSIGSYGGYVRRNGNLATLVGQFVRTGATLTTGASLLTILPSGNWPTESVPILCYLQGSTPGLATLGTNGRLTLNSYGQSTLTGEYVVVPTQTFPLS